MINTLSVGDYIFASKWKYGYSKHSLPFSVPLIPKRIFSSDPKRGDVVIFNQGTKHSSWGGGDRRRMFTINCTLRHTDEQIPLLREEVSGSARFLVDSVYGEAMLQSADSARMRHLEQGLANQDHLPELVRREREQRDEPSRG